MTGRESGERSAVPECSLILFSIHCAQRLEAPEGSPARSLDALSHTLDSGIEPCAVSVRRESVAPPKGEDTPVSSEWVDWWVGLRQSGRLGTLPVYLPAAARGLKSVTPSNVISLLLVLIPV